VKTKAEIGLDFIGSQDELTKEEKRKRATQQGND
jgi:hypothetical protein